MAFENISLLPPLSLDEDNKFNLFASNVNKFNNKRIPVMWYNRNKFIRNAGRKKINFRFIGYIKEANISAP